MFTSSNVSCTRTSFLIPCSVWLTNVSVANLQRSITFHQEGSGGGGGAFKVRALYAHQANGENQLSFDAHDVITLIGTQRDGWQFGENNCTRRLGWFPISFTEPLQTGSADAHVR